MKATNRAGNNSTPVVVNTSFEVRNDWKGSKNSTPGGIYCDRSALTCKVLRVVNITEMPWLNRVVEIFYFELQNCDTV